MLVHRCALAAAFAIIALLATPALASGQSCTFTIDAPGAAIPAEGGSVRVQVTARPATCSWAVSVVFGAATVSRTFHPAAGDGYFDAGFSATCMDPWYCPPTARMAMLQVTGDGGFTQSLALSQEPFLGPCLYGIDPPRLQLASGGGVSMVDVSAASYFPGAACGWSTTASAGWLRVPDSPFVGSASFPVTADRNRDGGRRRGIVRVGRAPIDVIQEGTQPVLNVELARGPGAEEILYDSTTGRYDVFTLESGVRDHVDWFTWGANKTIEAGDFNADGLTDVVVYDRSAGTCELDLALQPSRRDPAVFTGWDCGNGPVNATPTVLDANGDGLSDLFLYDASTGAWVLKLTNDVSTRGGLIYSDASTGTWAPGWQIHVARLDEDERDDLFVYNPSATEPNGGRWFRVYSRDGGAFEYVEGDMRWGRGWSIIPGNFDDDAQTELFLYGGAGTGYWFIVDFVSGSVRYFGGRLWATGWEIHAANFNGDGKTDLFLYQRAAGPIGGMWFRVLSTGAYDFTYIQGDVRWATGWRVSVGDLDGDGLSDVFLDGRSDGIAAQALTRNGGSATEYAYDLTWPVADTILLPRRVTP